MRMGRARAYFLAATRGKLCGRVIVGYGRMHACLVAP